MSTHTPPIAYKPDRRRAIAFLVGVLMLSVGVGIHVQMYLSMADMNYVLYEMTNSTLMWIGMALIVAGVAFAAWSLLARRTNSTSSAPSHENGLRMEAEHLGRAQVLMLAVCIVGLMIDVMKPATIAFVLPGLSAEYDISKGEAALLPLIALTGTAVGSLIWGQIADRAGRRPAILLAGLGFVATSICGAMPTFAWNLGMCWTMGLCAGGFLPVILTMIAETVPRRMRGFLTVLIVGLGTAAGYVAASGLSSLLIPHYSWRIMWLIGLPTGLLLIALARALPESYRYLRITGRDAEAAVVVRRFGLRPVMDDELSQPSRLLLPLARTRTLLDGRHRGLTGALGLYALSWGLINYGLFTWLPTMLVGDGVDASAAHQITKLLAQAALIALPAAVVVAILYGKWSTKRSLFVMAMLSAVGLALLGLLRILGTPQTALIPALVLLIIAVNGMAAVMLPYAAEVFPTELRGRGTGIIAGVGKAGGVVGTLLVGALSTIASGASIASLALLIPILLGLLALSREGIETRGRDLLDHASAEPQADSALA